MTAVSRAAALHRLRRLALLPLLLTALLWALKLAGALSWSWWVVFLPLLIPSGLIAIATLLVVGGAVFGLGMLAVVNWERANGRMTR